MRAVTLLEVAPLATDRVGTFHGTRPYLATGALDDDKSLTPKPVTYEQRPSRADLTVRPGDVCFARMQGTEKILEFDAHHANFILSTGFAVLRPIPNQLYSGFLRHWLRTREFQSSKDRLCSGATQKAITNDKIERLTIPLPRLDEQRWIAEVLDRAEALLAKRRAALAQLDTLTQSIFLDMFGDPATNPKGLSIEPLGKHLLFVTSGGRGWAEFYSPAGRRFIRSLDVRMNYIGDEDIVFVAAPDNAEARRTRVNAGDVLLTITGSRIGRVAPAPDELEGSYISQHVALLRVDSKRFQPNFLSFFLSFETGGQRQIARAQYGQTKPGLNFEQIRRFQIPVPPIELQREFDRRVRSVAKLKGTLRASLAAVDALFATLQHHAFRGEL